MFGVLLGSCYAFKYINLSTDISISANKMTLSNNADFLLP